MISYYTGTEQWSCIVSNVPWVCENEGEVKVSEKRSEVSDLITDIFFRALQTVLTTLTNTNHIT